MKHIPNSSENTNSASNPPNSVRIRVSGRIGVGGFGIRKRAEASQVGMSREEKGKIEHTSAVNPNILIDLPIPLLVLVKPEHGVGDK